MRVGKMLQEHFLDLRADQEGPLALIHHARAKAQRRSFTTKERRRVRERLVAASLSFGAAARCRVTASASRIA